jgi:hypothetical protein
MRKVTKIIVITFLLFVLLPEYKIYSQVNNFGNEVGGDVSDPGMQFSDDGFKPPTTKKEERIRKKALRISLSTKEVIILSRKERGKELKFFEKLRYPFIKRKKDKIDKLQAQADGMKFGSQDSSGNQMPGYVQNSKYQLTIKEKEVLNKKNSNDSLTIEEEKIYQKAIKKQKKQEKLKQKYEKDVVSDDEEQLLRNSRKYQYKDSITDAQKDQIKDIKRRKKHNDRINKKIRNYQIDSAYNSGGYLPKLPLKYRLKNMLPRFAPASKRPSSFIKKMRRLNRRYTLTDKEKEAYNQKKGGRPLGLFDQIRANKAATKMYLLTLKGKKLLKKQYYKYQTKETRKRLKKQQRDIKKRQRQKKNY